MRSVILCVVVFLSSCGGNNHQDLAAFIDAVSRDAVPTVIDIPKSESYHSFKYDVASYRSPFTPAIDSLPEKNLSHNEQDMVKPDFNRAKHYLESIQIEKMTMVGTISQFSIQWALLMTSNGQIHKVKKGQFIGRNHGRVTDVSNEYLQVNEIISNGQNTWANRVRTIKMQVIKQ
tara:strand:- start:804 stop:1328 length:525 start_codon:yes stop_codon:yes gene_type:complete